jgi:hypothetical protein
MKGHKSKMTRGPTQRKGQPNLAQAGRPTPFCHQFDLPFLELEDASTLSFYGRHHSEWTEINTLEVVHKEERLDQETIKEIIHEKDSSSPRRRPQAEEDIEALPWHPWS